MAFVIPACYLVTIGYALMALSCLLRKSGLFRVGWIPVALLAAVGSLAEVFGNEVCPRSESGTPLCYYSLAFALLIATTFYGWRKTRLLID